MNTQTQKIALITGGSRGLGRNTAESLARKGIDTVITYHSHADEARAVTAAVEAVGRKAVALQLDTGAVATFDHRREVQGIPEIGPIYLVVQTIPLHSKNLTTTITRTR